MAVLANILDRKLQIAQRVRNRRREGKISQMELANRSSVSLGSIKRFESSGEISLASLMRIAVVLGYENDFDMLFERRNYQSINDVLRENAAIKKYKYNESISSERQYAQDTIIRLVTRYL